MKKGTCGHICTDDSKFCTVCGVDMSNATEVDGAFEPSSALQPTRLEYSAQKVQYVFFLLFYIGILFFTLFPMIFPARAFRGFGAFGYGLRNQIAEFSELFYKVGDAKPLMLLIQMGIILLIVATIMIVGFAIAAMIVNARSRKKGMELNYPLLKIFNTIIFSSFAFILLLTFMWTTFTFVVAATLSFYIMLVNIRPTYALDLTTRRINEHNNTASTRMLILSALFAFCFAPVYSITEEQTPWQVNSFNFFNLFVNLFSKDKLPHVDLFLIILSAIILVLTSALFIFIFMRYLKAKKPCMLILNIGFGVQIFISILIGAYIRMIGETSSANISLSANFYFMLSIMIFAIVLYFVQRVMSLTKK